jgi:hypothetical protein
MRHYAGWVVVDVLDEPAADGQRILRIQSPDGAQETWSHRTSRCSARKGEGDAGGRSVTGSSWKRERDRHEKAVARINGKYCVREQPRSWWEEEDDESAEVRLEDILAALEGTEGGALIPK